MPKIVLFIAVVLLIVACSSAETVTSTSSGSGSGSGGSGGASSSTGPAMADADIPFCAKARDVCFDATSAQGQCVAVGGPCCTGCITPTGQCRLGYADGACGAQGRDCFDASTDPQIIGEGMCGPGGLAIGAKSCASATPCPPPYAKCQEYRCDFSALCESTEIPGCVP